MSCRRFQPVTDDGANNFYYIMFIGPVFTREITIAPRRPQTFIVRSVYGALLLVIISTAWLVVTGTQLIRDTGDFSRFGSTLFLLVAPLQLVLTVFFSAMLSAGAVAQEKDRKTMLLLLLTRMSGSELVLGKLFASLLNVLVMISVSLPIFMIIAILGGISYPQIVRVLLVTVFASLACGSLGSCIALWRDKTFQALATTVLILVFWFGIWETIGLGLFGQIIFGYSCESIAAAMSPWSTVILSCKPAIDWTTGHSSIFDQIASVVGPIKPFLIICAVFTAAINLYAIMMIRVWNPSRETRNTTIEEDTWRKEDENEPAVSESSEPKEKPVGYISAGPGKIRHAWDNPIIWREICTKAYGKKMWFIRGAYMFFVAMCAIVLHRIFQTNVVVGVEQLAGPMVPLLLLSLFLVNAQAVTSLTSERDSGTFDLLLVSDLTPKEFVYGKLGGVFWNVKAMVIFPLLLCGYLYWARAVDGTSLFFLFVGLLTLYAFVAMIGIHIGMQYTNTRSAAATSLGIIFFLFVGVSACMWIMVAFSGSFEAQLQPFLAFMVGGAIGLYVTLGAKNPSNAIMLASFVLPIATFYAITSMLLGQYHLVFIAILAAYGFTTAAMLIPAVDEFDVATGRTTAD